MVSSLSVVVPVYNSELTILPLVERLHSVLPGIVNAFEIILVNDNSSDRSWSVIEETCAKYPQARGVTLMRNYGQHNALLCGIRLATMDFIVTIDDDLQHPPEEIPVLLQKINEGFDVVYGTPEKETHGILRDQASRITKWAMQGALGATNARSVSAFRAFRTPLREAFASYQGAFVSIDVLLTWATTRFAAVTVRHDERTIGVSNYTLRKLIVHALNMITGFTTLPLQFASMLGFSFMIFGVFVFMYVVGRYLLQGSSVPGFPFLASIISIFSGVQLFALGIIGEYLARMHFRSMQKPPYVVREACGLDAEHENVSQ